MGACLIFFMSLYRKYRPQSFANLVGQDHIRTTLMNALKNDKVNHAYLFTGPRGTGKTSTARLVAKAINCENLKEAEPCESCDICRDITDGRLIDLIEIDAASNRGIDEIRDLREKINFAPTRARSKVYIIDEVHMLTKEAFNALLKTLEEPPAHVFFILATTEVHKIPETILSRCQRFDFKRIEDTVLVQRLAWIAEQEKIEAESAALEEIAHKAQGGLRDAIGLLEQLSVNGKLSFDHVRDVLGISGKVSLEKLYGFLQSQDGGKAVEEINALYNEGYDLTQFTKDFLELLRQKMLEQVREGNDLELKRVLAWIEHFQRAYEGAKFATIPQLPLEVAAVQSCAWQTAAGLAEERAHGGIEHGPKTATLKPMMQKSGTGMNDSSATSVARTNPGASAAASTGAGMRTSAEARASASSPMRTGAEMRTGASAATRAGASAGKIVSESFGDASHQTLQKAAALSSEVLLMQWPHIVKAIKNVTAKRTLSAGKFVGLDGAEVKIAFGTQFHASKMKEFANRLAVEEALFTVFQVPLKVVSVVDESLAVQNGNGGLENGSANVSAPLDEKTSQLLAMMGGELIE